MWNWVMTFEKPQTRDHNSVPLASTACTTGPLENESHLRMIIEQFPAVLWTTDRDLCFTSSLGAGLKGLGLEANMVVGKSLVEYFQTSDPEFPPLAAHIRCLDGESIRYTFNWEQREFQTTVEPLRDENGAIIGCIGIALDITERILAHEALCESEHRFRAIVENAPDLILKLDAEGIIQFINQTLPEYNVQDVIGTSAYDYMTPACAQQYRTAVRNTFASGMHQTLEVEETGGTTWLAQLVPMKRDDQVISVMVIATDITERKRLQEFAARAQRLETAGRIAGQVAHDFNNLLGPLMAYPELLKGIITDSRALKYIDDMEVAASQMAEINQQLLTLGRRGHYNQVPMNLNQTVVSVLNQMQPLPETLVLHQDLADDLMNMKGGQAQLYRAVMNLIANARDAMQDIGELTMRTQNYYIDEALGNIGHIPRGEYVRLTIADTGCGMSEETVSKMFDPFFTMKKSDRRRGSGLGLSVVHAVLEDHSGHIDCRSRIGEGTTYDLYFPICREEAETLPDTQVVGGDEHILVIDDDRLQRNVARTLLESLGYTVTEAESGEEGLQHLRRQPHDLIIVDMIMPDGIDGADTCRGAFEINPEQRAILISGYAESERVQDALRCGAGAFVRKPLTLKSIALAVRRELDREAKLAASV
jgi:two-component system cell cycle sensor histidine kinase/response regulator CckA